MKCPLNRLCECDPDCALRVKVTVSSDNGYTTGKACAFAVMASNVDFKSSAVFVSETTFTGNLKPGEAGTSISKIMCDIANDVELPDTFVKEAKCEPQS